MTGKFLLLCSSPHPARQAETRLFSDPWMSEVADPWMSEVADLLQEGLAPLLRADVLGDGL